MDKLTKDILNRRINENRKRLQDERDLRAKNILESDNELIDESIIFSDKVNKRRRYEVLWVYPQTARDIAKFSNWMVDCKFYGEWNDERDVWKFEDEDIDALEMAIEREMTRNRISVRYESEMNENIDMSTFDKFVIESNNVNEGAKSVEEIKAKWQDKIAKAKEKWHDKKEKAVAAAKEKGKSPGEAKGTVARKELDEIFGLEDKMKKEIAKFKTKTKNKH